MTLEAFGSDYTLTLNVTCPDQGWYKSVSPRFADIKLFLTDDPNHIFSGDPRIVFEPQSGFGTRSTTITTTLKNVEELARAPSAARRWPDAPTKSGYVVDGIRAAEMLTGGWLKPP